jgi:hypothetical protein
VKLPSLDHVVSLIALGILMASATTASAAPLECMQRFRLKDFVIGAWWGPDPSEEGYRLYQEAGFNVLMTYRNRANPKYGEDYQLPDREMELAEKVGLWVMLDTYMRNDTPWGGAKLDPPEEHPNHHPARLGELKWLQERYGEHPRLVGYLLGDNCGLHGYMVENAQYLQQTAPGLFPWMSTNPNIEGQGQAPMPLLTTQNYPFLYQADAPEEQKRKAYCDRLEIDRQCANRLNMSLWPFLNCCGAVSPSQLRFQLFACVAYGSQGIWYFHYNDNVWDPKDEKPGPLYEAAKEGNRYIASIGGKVIGHRCPGVFHTGGPEAAEGCLTPGPAQIIASMSEGLMAGLLVPEKQFVGGNHLPDCIMVVDKRTVPEGAEEPDQRTVQIELGLGLKASPLYPWDDGATPAPSGRVELRLKAGQGVLLAVEDR